ncbi:Loganic acid O-methyltransferase [Camellia lanceoleosa]|uniref:Loganic acid O-methyltransferase n=1 Tax=Camellia lanceoleosa TaxID=1840588 RepID=A0ACC0G4G6_9ERIC|nr:Loganic acid O-methyltransferase [Camellia lanceoleosa]
MTTVLEVNLVILELRLCQREASIIVEALINEVIAEKLDIENISSTSNTIRIADLGCASGTNTIFATQNIIEVVEKLYRSKGFESKIPEFQVLFNDLPTNDFNTLFTSSLPSENNYFVAAVPGSFHGRLFPESSLHIVHCSCGLHWLSKVPEEILNKDSPAWNKGKIYYTSASDQVADAYASQFDRDVDNFLNARAVEMVSGGLMLLLTIAAADGVSRSEMPQGWVHDAFGSSLMDMAKEGLISEAKVDSFNVPIYIVRPNDMVRAVERNGCFSIERMQLTDPLLKIDEPLDMHASVTHTRAALGGLIAKHFGIEKHFESEIMDEMFDRFDKKAVVFSTMEPRYKKNIVLFVTLKRK